MLRRILFVLIAIILAAVGGQFAISSNVDIQIGDLLQKGNQSPFMSVVVLDDDKSFVERNLVLRIDLQSTTEQLSSITIRNHIQIKPWGAVINHQAFLAPAIANLVVDLELSSWLQSTLIDQPFITGQSSINLQSKVETSWQSIHYFGRVKEVDIQLSPLIFVASFDVIGKTEGVLEWPGLKVTDHRNVGEQAPVSYKLANLSQTYSGYLNEGTVFLGDHLLKVEQVRYQDSGLNQVFDLDDLQIFVETKRIDQSLISEASLSFDSIKLVSEDPLEMKDLLVNASFNSNDYHAYIELHRQIQSGQNQPAITPELVESLQNMVQAGLSIDISQLSVLLGESKLSGNLSTEIMENRVPLALSPATAFNLLPYVNAKANFKVDKTINRNPAYSDALMGMLLTGLLVDAGEYYELNAAFNDGSPMLNGQSIPLSFQ